VGDLLDKPHDHGGRALNRPIASLVIAAPVIVGILLLPQKPGVHPGASKSTTKASDLMGEIADQSDDASFAIELPRRGALNRWIPISAIGNSMRWAYRSADPYRVSS
jgi:hypothetical protein